MDFRNDFSPMILAKPKSHSFACGMPVSDVRRTFSGLRSQCTTSFLWRYCRAVRICEGGEWTGSERRQVTNCASVRHMDKGVRRANQANSGQLYWADWPSCTCTHFTLACAAV